MTATLPTVIKSATNLAAPTDDGDELFGDVFDDIAPIDSFTRKKMAVGTGLAALVAFAGCTRTQLGSKLGWNKSQISSVLSGKGNLTLKTMHDVGAALGYDFDVVFRSPQCRYALQPWEPVSGLNATTRAISMMAVVTVVALAGVTVAVSMALSPEPPVPQEAIKSCIEKGWVPDYKKGNGRVDFICKPLVDKALSKE